MHDLDQRKRGANTDRPQRAKLRSKLATRTSLLHRRPKTTAMLILAMTDGLSNAQALELPNANASCRIRQIPTLGLARCTPTRQPCPCGR